MTALVLVPSPVTATEVIDRMQALLKHPSAWTKNQYARDKDDWKVSPADPEAVCWCVLGALQKSVTDLEAGPKIKTAALAAVISALVASHPEAWDVAEWNDDPRRTFGEVCLLLQAASFEISS